MISTLLVSLANRFQRQVLGKECAMLKAVGSSSSTLSPRWPPNAHVHSSWRTPKVWPHNTAEHSMPFLQEELRHMAGSAYKVNFRIINTADLGIPQHRERVYIVGLLRAAIVPGRSFTWPTPRGRKPLPQTLGWAPTLPAPGEAYKREKRLFAHTSPRIRKRLRAALRSIRMRGLDPRSVTEPVVVGIGGIKPHWMHGVSPCLTRARATTGHYLPALGRRLTVQERLRLQALPRSIHDRCSEGDVSDRQLGALIGNSLSLNVLEALLSHILVACGLASPRLAGGLGQAGRQLQIGALLG